MQAQKWENKLKTNREKRVCGRGRAYKQTEVGSLDKKA